MPEQCDVHLVRQRRPVGGGEPASAKYGRVIARPPSVAPTVSRSAADTTGCDVGAAARLDAGGVAARTGRTSRRGSAWGDSTTYSPPASGEARGEREGRLGA
ncbi:MAG: hypothetical protein AVDCRST_MAG64-324 [uncultured Phycisphaerae bacterium]|uniref:Uncharacterized protein n=1 Tax=uncultured Phycisphaerae bacterium TaxID=904963 RepID=A0A6J4N2F6_9BACT|nr:MAG: hypothetical protein AVDCRST_MAG64-324 [uncultured Phycisphaerae bacterium]